MKIRIPAVFAAVCFLASALPAAAENDPESFVLSLAQARLAAEQYSPALRLAQYTLQAAEAQSVSADSFRYPQADLNGTYFYQTHIPTQTVAGAAIEMGDNDNYRVGPSLSYTLFDGGTTRNHAASARLNTEAKVQELRAQKRNLRYSVGTSYARVQIGAVNLGLMLDSLLLARNQRADIDLRFNAGTASRLDQLSAHKELLSYTLRFQQAQNDLSLALQDLLALVGEPGPDNTARPLPSGLAAELPPDIAAPTLLITVDRLQDTIAELTAELNDRTVPGENTPQIKAGSLTAQSLRKAAQSRQGADRPRITLSAESLQAYPDLSNREQYTNNIFSVTVSVPLWNAHRNRGLADIDLNQSRAEEQRTARTLRELLRDDRKASDTIANLEQQLHLSRQASRQAEEISRLTYQSYIAGTSTYLEVQRANLLFLQDRVYTAQLEYAFIERLTEKMYLSGNADR